jgi:magnesium-transporting ATPase (P-type)
VTVPAGAPVSALAPGEDGLVWHTLRADRVLQAEVVDGQRGLTSAEAASRAGRFGPNKFDAAKAEPRWRAFLRQYTDLMQIVLLVAGLLSLALQEWETGIVLIVLTLFNAVLGLQQEGKAAAAVSALQKMMIIKARVVRDGQLQELPAEQLVPGDIVSVEAGDIVPADGRLLRAATLEVAESALTGESLPVSKGTEPVEGTGTPLGDRTDMVYMNTNVTRGSGEFVVTATGMATEVGHISGMLQAEQAVKTPLTRQLDKLTRQILWIAGVALIVSMVLNLARGDTFSAVFTAGVAFAIGAIPENLPAVVTAILASGTQALARVGAIMKRLASTETLGSTSAVNSDKTGTLTLNQMTAVQMAVVGRRYAIEGNGYSTDGQITRVAGQAGIGMDEFLLPMVLASDAVLSGGELIGDPTEGALVVLAAKGGIDAVFTRQAYPRIAELPFDAAYKLMATFPKMTDASGADAPALKKADIGIAMGITGTEVTKEAAVMVLTDDNFSTIVKAVELGRGLYDNLVKYVRFQMGCLFGFIISFLGASIFNIAGGVPFLPLQTLWINFTTLLFQAIGLGYGRPAPGLMERQPRPPDRPILTRSGFAWLVCVGLVMGAGTLGVISWAEQVHTQAIAHTMGVVTFSLYALFFSIETRDERRTAFSLDTFSDSKFVIATGVSVLTLLLTTVFGPLQALLKTTSLDVRQWLICLAVALSIVVVSEVRKAVARRRTVPSDPNDPITR